MSVCEQGGVVALGQSRPETLICDVVCFPSGRASTHEDHLVLPPGSGEDKNGIG